MAKKPSSKAGGAAALPGRYLRFQKAHPNVFAAYDALGTACQEAGPLSARARALVKLALAVGARLEGAVHSHTRRALDAGCTPDEIRHAILLATTTLGFPTMMAALSWVDDVLEVKG
jgi:alkylhydroperoxidase/carboxymuconolactone decarboxylase family protein YurZ